MSGWHLLPLYVEWQRALAAKEARRGDATAALREEQARLRFEWAASEVPPGEPS